MRGRTAAPVALRFTRTEGLLNLLVDSTGIKLLDTGEWQVRAQ